ncbi:MAG: serine acetyltransferase [Deltaproteobacteria bacterium]|nr:MAG: serine acetyltransferase [Deltaproteobacteria bacterium]
MGFWHDMRHKRQIYERDAARPVSMARILLADGTSANLLYRAMRWSARRRLRGLAYACQFANKLINHCVIGVDAEFGPGFVLLHPTGVVINSKVKGGRNVALESGVVIGDDKGRSPVLGDDVFVGSGAKVIGGVEVGSGARIGANAVVVKPVEPDTTVVGIPARPVARRREGP